MPRLGLLLLLVCCWLPLAAMQSESVGDLVEDPTAYLKKLKEEAAEYRLERLNATIEPKADAEAAAAVTEIETVYASGDFKATYKLAARAFKRHRMTAGTQTLGDLKRLQILGYARYDKLSYAREELARLWFSFPDYARLDEAMLATLECAERAQRFEALIDLDAEHPSEVVNIDGTGFASEVIKVFRFLSDFGDRVAIGARADLGLARAELLGGDPKDLTPSRMAYSDFLSRHPNHPLTFTAICELALSHLITYRGELYDVGALINAAMIIDQAELVAGDDPEKAALVVKYRTRIRGWHQDRDLSVARWYRGRHRPAWLAWLKEPSDYNWDEAARFYYNEVILRDAASDQARAARRELESLPPSGQAPFRADLLPETAR